MFPHHPSLVCKFNKSFYSSLRLKKLCRWRVISLFRGVASLQRGMFKADTFWTIHKFETLTHFETIRLVTGLVERIGF